MTKAEQKKAVQFTRMCKFWRTNECKMGADCTFAHATLELRPSPKPCFEFSKTGSCKRGQACRFVHSTDPKKSKSVHTQSSKGDGLFAPATRSVGAADVACRSSSDSNGQLPMFDMPKLTQLFPPVEADFQSLHQFKHDLRMREIRQGHFVHDFAQGDFFQTADAEAHLHSCPSEVFLGFEDTHRPLALAPDGGPWRPEDAAATVSLAAARWLNDEPAAQAEVRSSEPMSFWL